MKENTAFTASNIITCLRIFFTFVWLGFASQISLLSINYDAFGPYVCFVALFFVLLSLSDFLDGYLARKQGTVSTLGIYLDPISDKILVLAGLLTLLNWNYVNVFIVLLIFTREFLVDALRIIAATKKIIVPASLLGKVKTATTLISISCYLFAAVGFGPIGGSIFYLSGAAFLCIAVITTVWSGIDYYVKISRKLKRA